MRPMRGRTLNARVRAHLGGNEVPHVIHRTFPEYLAGDVAIASKEYLIGPAAEVVRFSGDPLTLFQARSRSAQLIGPPILEQIEVPGERSGQGFFDHLGAEFTGIGAAHGLDFTGFRGGVDPLTLLKPPVIDRFGRFEGYDPTAPVFDQIEVDGTSPRLGLREGVILFRFEDAPMFACCRRTDGMHEEYRLTIVARDLMRAQRVLNAFLEHERAHSIFRGRLIRPEIDYSDRVSQAEILPFAGVGWDQVVLPDQLRHRIERDVLQYIRAADRLTANDIPPKRSILFHGPPGTGKTFMCKLLATELHGFTSVLITGENLRRPEGAFALARSLAPALLFFEDVDLVAKDRDGSPCPMALGGLLNELDGLPRSDRIYVV